MKVNTTTGLCPTVVYLISIITGKTLYKGAVLSIGQLNNFFNADRMEFPDIHITLIARS
jgi:hypothetical protein